MVKTKNGVQLAGEWKFRKLPRRWEEEKNASAEWHEWQLSASQNTM
jgi:hypothetical protein